MSGRERAAGTRADAATARRPFRAVDVLSGNIDRREQAHPERARKQISAQLEPAQLRLLGEMHARLNATARSRIEKSELVGLGIELLAAALDDADQEPAPEPGGKSRPPSAVRRQRSEERTAFADAEELRTYVREYVRTQSER